MIFNQTKLRDAFVIELDKFEDERGFFARTWDKTIFEKNGLNPTLVQVNISFNLKKGTIRGLHYQKPPFEEAKLVRCTRGKIFDVIIDLRKNSQTYKDWFGEKLTQENHKMLYVPERFAHGYQTLEDNTEILYQVSQIYSPSSEEGIRWNDPAFKIKWPLKQSTISLKDNSYPNSKFSS